MKSILVATDGSENSKKALMEAKILAKWSDSKITIINVESNIPAYIQGDQVDTITKSATEHQNEILEEALKIFQDFSGEVDIVRRKGKEGEEIIKEAEKEDYDLIVMGSRGQGGFFRAILGSTTNKVLNHVSKNILIIK